MRNTRSKTAASKGFASWPRTKAANASKFASPKVRSKYVETDSESDFELDSTNDAIHKSQPGKQKGQVCEDEGILVDSRAASLFKNHLPVEVHQHISSFLPTDQDVFNYILICKTTAGCITESVWRQRSELIFDIVEGRGIKEVVLKYAFRQDISRQWISFDLHKFAGLIDQDTREAQIATARHCVLMLKDLILESNAKRAHDDEGNRVVRGKNLQFICDMISGSNGKSYLDILDAVLMTGLDEKYMSQCGYASLLFAHKTTIADQDTLLQYTVQVCLAPLFLHPRYCIGKVAHFDVSQYSVYALEHSCPIFLGDHKENANIRWVLQALNFFKYHLKTGGEGLLAHAYKDLPNDQYPEMWTGNIQNGTLNLGKNWKGAHTYMDPTDLKSLRLAHSYKSYHSEHSIYPDSLDSGETFSDICVFFDETLYSASKWPSNWEEILHSDTFKKLNTLRKSRSRPKIRYFWGTSRGSKSGHFFGAIHSVDEQQGIPGFQRIVLMKFYSKLDENDEETFDPEQVWAYEGCVLPGGKIIVGQWWAARATLHEYRQGGPFIWWNVERSDAEIPIKQEDALNFLDTVEVDSIHADY